MQLTQQGILLSKAGSSLTVTITENANDPIDTEYFIATVVFNREVTELLAADFSISNATIENIYTSDNITFLATVFPTFGGNVSVSIPAGNVAGVAGGLNTVSNTITVNVVSDYTTNMWDEWWPQRQAYMNTGGTLVSNWKGIRNQKRFTGVGAAFPSAGKYTLSGTNYFNTSNAVATGWTGDFSIFMRIKNAATLTQTTATLFNSSGGTAFRIDAKNASNKIQVVVGGVTTAHATQAFIQDGGEHSVGFVIDFGAGTCKYFLDGSLTATINFTGTADMDWTGTWSGALCRLAGTTYFNQTWDKLRIYQEAVSDANAQVITNNSNLFHTFTVSATKNVKAYVFYGESIMRGYTATAGDMPVELQAEFVDILGWKNVTDGFMTTIAGTQPVTECGPQLKCLYDLRLKYPDHDIVYFFQGAAGSTLDLTPTETNSWNSPTGDLLENAKGSFLNGMKVLVDIELRNIVSIEAFMAQGINDCDNLTRANNYEGNADAWIPYVRSNFTYGGDSLNKIVWCGPHNSLPAGSHPYTSTVRTGLTNAATTAGTVPVIFPDNNTTYPKEADSIHLTPTGTVNLGAAAAVEL